VLYNWIIEQFLVLYIKGTEKMEREMGGNGAMITV